MLLPGVEGIPLVLHAMKPTPPPVPLPVWRDLLDAALSFRAARPWEWLYDRDSFALIDDQQRPWFPAVLGAAGQVFGLALYRGEAGLRFLLNVEEDCAEKPHDIAFEQDALMLDWGAKQALAPEDLALLAQLGHAPRPRERKAWPCFRSHAPGWYPWFLTAEEALQLTLGLRATLACAELAKRTPDFFAPGDEDIHVLPTVSMGAALTGPLRRDQVTWRHWEMPTAHPARVPSPASWPEIATRPLTKGCVLEFDLFHTMMPVAEGARPYFPRLALMADGKTGYIYAMEMGNPTRGWGELVVTVWEKALQPMQSRPEFVSILRSEWFEALRPLAETIGVRLLLQERLPAIEEARSSLEAFQYR